MWPKYLRCEDTMRWMEEAPADGSTMARSVMALLEAASQRGGRPGVSAAMLYKLP